MDTGLNVGEHTVNHNAPANEVRIRVNVSIRGVLLLVPCGSAHKVEYLVVEALQKYHRIIHPLDVDTQKDLNRKHVRLIKKVIGGAVLDFEDLVVDVLSDGETVDMVVKGDAVDAQLYNKTTDKAISIDHLSFENGINLHAPRKLIDHKDVVNLDGETLTIKNLYRLGEGELAIGLTKESWGNVDRARKLVNHIVDENKVVYGITTGFGMFASTVIDSSKIGELQENLIRSHSAGVGQGLSMERTKMLLALRINVLAKGYSGVRRETLQRYIAAFNASCLPFVPEQGSVGASGDLAPLSHLALGMMGEGKMWSPLTGWTDARNALEAAGIIPIKLQAKEGLALINGTQLITALGAEAVYRAENLARQADVIAALTLEVCKGTTRAFDQIVNDTRQHKGQSDVARCFRALLHNDLFRSEISQSHRFCSKVQDAYTLRCCPQVHGVVRDTIAFVQGIISTEINSATDNPMVFADQQLIISAGNFHGEYPAKSLDYLAIGVHELASISERRIERLVNPTYSGLPAFLTNNGGLNSGFMIAHCTAASLVSENKVLCHPSSIDSIPTSGGQEDHVSMGGFSARKVLKVVEHTEHVLAIELLAACQAIEFLRPLKSTEPLESVFQLVRGVVKAWDRDRYMAPDIQAAAKLVRNNEVWNAVAPYINEYENHQVIDLEVNSPASYSKKAPKRKLCKHVAGSRGVFNKSVKRNA